MEDFSTKDLYKEKFFVINRKHVLEKLNGGELHLFDTLMRKLSTNNKYLVVNQDEPYAKDVWNLIEKNEQKEIIAFTGRQGAGKDYQCGLLVEKGFKKFAFADALREICFTSLGIKYDYGMKHYDELKTKTVTDFGYTLRDVMEQLGTQGIRKYDNDFWVCCLLKNIKDSKAKKICVSDLRFPNEFKGLAKFAKENGYKFTCYFCDYHSVRYKADNTHDSAKMSNWLKSKGFTDLTQVHINDILNYEEEGE